MSTKKALDVVVAGAGPVGMTAAHALALDGHRVTVLEAGAELSSESRASTFHPATLDLLDELGLAIPLHDGAVHVPDYQYRDRRDGLIARFDFGRLAGLTKHPYRLQIEQRWLTRIILPRLLEAGGTVKFGARVVGASSTGDRPTLRYEEGGREHELPADLIVGADGASSAVRKSLGIDFDGMTYPERYLVASTPFEFRDVMPDISWVNYVSDPAEWLLMLRTPDYWRVMFPIADGVSDEAAQQPEEVQRRLQGVHALDRPYPVLHTTVYRVHQRVASRYVDGRVALVGDAAHINNPLGGLGMNSGIFDAFALRDTVRRGLDRDLSAELAGFGRERRQASVDYVGVQTDRNWSQIRESDLQTRRANALAMRATADDADKTLEFLKRVSMLEQVPA